jgi:hypothetical protein
MRSQIRIVTRYCLHSFEQLILEKMADAEDVDYEDEAMDSAATAKVSAAGAKGRGHNAKSSGAAEVHTI